MSCIVHVKPELTSEKTVSIKYTVITRQRELHRLLVWSFFAVKFKVMKSFGINFSIDFSCGGGGVGGVLWILSDMDVQSFWGGLKFLIPGIFLDR